MNMTLLAWTGQPMNEKEEVVCNKCNNGLINLRRSAWFDPYLPSPKSEGSYVHYTCLGERRQAEIAAGA